MSGGGWKKPFEDVARMDSRGIAQIGRTFGLQGVVDEAKHNEKNPGRAITKAGINAALWYLGGEAGSALGGTGTAATAAQTAGQYGSMTAEQIAQQLAPVALGENVGTMGEGVSSMGGLLAGGTPETAQTASLLSQAPQGAANTMEAGLPEYSYTPSNLKYAFQNANAGNGTPLSQNLANYYKDAANNAMNGSMFNRFVAGAKGPAGKKLAMDTAMKMMQPPQQQAMPQGRPAPQGQPAPLNNPYQSNPYGPGGNSMGLTEEMKQKLRAMGYQI